MSAPTDEQMVDDPSERCWPKYPVLPMKRHLEGPMEFGFFHHPGGEAAPSFFHGIYRNPREATATNLAPHEVLAEGWTVD